MSLRKSLLLSAGMAGFLLAGPERAEFRFDSAVSIPLECQVEMVLRTEEESPRTVRDEIDAQLMFLQGKLNQYDSAADIGHADIQIKKFEPIEGVEMRKVTYTAKMLVAWSRKWQAPESLRMAFPARADEAGLQAFFDAYSPHCSESNDDPEMNRDSYFYYYRPDKKQCPLFSKKGAEDIVSYATLKLDASKAQASGKCPEYQKIHADKKLVFTCIFGTNEKGATSNNDAGIQSYNSMYRLLRNRFKYRPDKMNVKLGSDALPGAQHPDVEMEWVFSDMGTVNVNILLVDKEGLINPAKAFADKYNERTKISDFVSYNGHSGYGENIRALTAMGTFLPGQWQLFYVNGCGSFAYIDDSLRGAHQKANPGSKPYEWFNIITNAMPAKFNQNAPSNMAIIEAFLYKNKTYRQILDAFDPCQGANVTGDEDNTCRLP